MYGIRLCVYEFVRDFHQSGDRTRRKEESDSGDRRAISLDTIIRIRSGAHTLIRGSRIGFPKPQTRKSASRDACRELFAFSSVLFFRLLSPPHSRGVFRKVIFADRPIRLETQKLNRISPRRKTNPFYQQPRNVKLTPVTSLFKIIVFLFFFLLVHSAITNSRRVK